MGNANEITETSMSRFAYLLLFSIVAVMLLTIVMAEEEVAAEEPLDSPKIQYLQLKPEIIANYGTSSGKPRLLNADVTLQIADEDTADKVSMFLIPIRHDLIMMFSNLKHDEANSGAQVEALRAKALETVQTSLSDWSGGLEVADVIFTKFVTE